MQTHFDDSHGNDKSKEIVFMRELMERAKKAEQERSSLIASAGVPTAEWLAKNGMHVRHLPDDAQGITRISIGGGDNLPVVVNYCAIRGTVEQCVTLLEMAIEALRGKPD